MPPHVSPEVSRSFGFVHPAYHGIPGSYPVMPGAGVPFAPPFGGGNFSIPANGFPVHPPPSGLATGQGSPRARCFPTGDFGAHVHRNEIYAPHHGYPDRRY